ncbi:Dipeptidyl aminopeptidase [Kappamyces sp. JEL0680]|nr:Dipeptidyl aminopeptidase [Kappamyces sp. JEL0680]
MTVPGTWKSPIQSSSLTVSSYRYNYTYVDKARGMHWLLEERPSEKGRTAALAISAAAVTGSTRMEEFFPEYDLTSSVHEYGGGAFSARDGLKVFVDGASGNVLVQLDDGLPVKILIDSAAAAHQTNYADFDIHPSKKWIACIREVHYGEEADQVVNSICAIDVATGTTTDLVMGMDFYVSPRFSPDGTRLIWVAWNHPSMQWHKSALYGGNVSSTMNLGGARQLSLLESISRPLWGTSDVVYFASDSPGYYNIASYSFATGETHFLTDMEAEFSAPDWYLCWSTFDVLPDGRLVAAYSEKGEAVLALVDPVGKSVCPVAQGVYATIEQVRTIGNTVFFLGRTTHCAQSLYCLNLDTMKTTLLKRSSQLDLDRALISTHQHMTFPTKDGGLSYMIYYAPKNPNYELTQPPPLVVNLHGGPTDHAFGGLELRVQFWTSRGFAFVDCNYGGSSNYGRAHRERLDGRWGIVDVDDACDCALFLASKGLADRERLAIIGGSAGGYTVLACLTFRPDVFKAATNLFGICSLESMEKLTHKLEAHYLSGLLGGSSKEVPQVYHDRSPIFFADRISVPLLVQQGSEDRVVPPNQSEMIVEAIRKRGGKVQYQLFAGEGHGFRQAVHIQQQIETELRFYQQVFGLDHTN